MERKTLGSFISALRRAAGMTQRDLAEKLNVSDKAISRWERDESAPDLTLLPLLADLFDITVDELLRGERRMASQEIKEETARGREESGRRQRLLLANRLQKHKNILYIPIGLETGGLLVALICNFGFYRAALGFLFGITFLAAAVICSLVFTGAALPTDEEEYDPKLIAQYKKDVLTYTYRVLFGAFLLFLPILLIGWLWFVSGDTYVGWKLDTFLFLIPILELILGGIACEIGRFCILPRILTRFGACEEEKDKERRKRIGKLARRCVVTLLCALIVPALLLFCMMEAVDKRTAFTRGQEFTTFEEFKEYIETYKPEVRYYSGGVIVYEEDYTVLENGEYVNSEGEQEEGVLHQVPALNEDGSKDNYNVLYSYYHRNGEVMLVRWSVESEDRLPVRVYTVYDFMQSETVWSVICVGLGVVMAAEAAVTLAVYLKKRKGILRGE